jgi:hypothetical protein
MLCLTRKSSDSDSFPSTNNIDDGTFTDIGVSNCTHNEPLPVYYALIFLSIRILVNFIENFFSFLFEDGDELLSGEDRLRVEI